MTMLEQLKQIDPDKLSPENRQRLEAVKARLEAIEEDRILREAQQEAARNDPVRRLEQIEEEARQAERARLLRQRNDEAEAVFAREEKARGEGLVQVVRSADCPIVIRHVSREAFLEMQRRTQALLEAGKAEDADDVAT